MKLRYLICVAAAGVTLHLPAAANEQDPFDRIESALNPEVLLRGVIREDDVSLLFRHIRASIAASARGEEARGSEEFNRRTDEISREMAARGGVLLGVMLNAFEATAKQVIREEFGAGAARPLPQRNSPFSGSSIE